MSVKKSVMGWRPSRSFLWTLYGLAWFVWLVAAGGRGGPGKLHGTLIQAPKIGAVMVAYAAANGNAFPTGNSSTEVFQALIDKGFVTDPSLFYVPQPGKVRGVAGQRLKPENVCWDVTAGLDPSASDDLPLVFTTGYKLNYVAGGSAVRLAKTHPASPSRVWDEFWGRSALFPTAKEPESITIFYKRGNASLRQSVDEASSVPNIISPGAVLGGKTYRQLTPKGELK